MALSVYNVKKWSKMLMGKSILHVNQDLGKCFKPKELKGYFNNLTEKVTKEPGLLDNDQLPVNISEDGQKVVFPVAIFQYGLGAYDLYLQSKEEKYLSKFKQCVEWAISHQEESGAWNNFYYIYPDNPYVAMCQGEGASLLVRAYNEFNEDKYINAAKKALEFMLKPIEQGGTSLYDNDELILMEYTHLPAVLNGWIFALFGLYDYCLIEPNIKFQESLSQTLATLKRKIPSYDCQYWSMYDSKGMIASPFYHNLHIAQLQALSMIDDRKVFQKYVFTFSKYKSSLLCRFRAFSLKAFQKMKE